MQSSAILSAVRNCTLSRLCLQSIRSSSFQSPSGWKQPHHITKWTFHQGSGSIRTCWTRFPRDCLLRSARGQRKVKLQYAWRLRPSWRRSQVATAIGNRSVFHSWRRLRVIHRLSCSLLQSLSRGEAFSRERARIWRGRSQSDAPNKLLWPLTFIYNY